MKDFEEISIVDEPFAPTTKGMHLHECEDCHELLWIPIAKEGIGMWRRHDMNLTTRYCRGMLRRTERAKNEEFLHRIKSE